MIQYRLSCFDRVGRIGKLDGFVAENDAAAVAFVQARHPEFTCELWEQSRFVARVRDDSFQLNPAVLWS